MAEFYVDYFYPTFLMVGITIPVLYLIIEIIKGLFK